MAASLTPSNAIFYAQFYLRGGWKNTLMVAGGYLAILGGAIWLSSVSNSSRSSTLSGWTNGLLALQLVLLLLYGTFRVSAGVRNDITSKIIESHRLMPLSAFHAVLGYLLGAPAQAIALGLVNFGLGILTTSATTGDLAHWVFANAMLAAFAAVIWVVNAQIAFAARGGFPLLVILMLTAVGNNGTTLALLPALNVLTCPLVGRSVFSTRADFSEVTFSYGAALVSQFVIGAIAFTACMRKYRSPDALGLNASLGVLLVAAWVAISAVGMQFIDEFEPYYLRYYQRSVRPGQFVASIVTAMLLAIIPLSSAARTITAWRRNGGATPAMPRKPWPMFATIAGLVLAIGMLLLVHPELEKSASRMTFLACGQTLIVVAAFSACMALLFRWAYLAVSRAWLIALIWLILTWIAPLIADLVYASLNDRSQSQGIISTLSPPAALSNIWSGGSVPLWAGLIWQIALVAPLAILFTNQQRRKQSALAPAVVLAG